MPQTKKPTEYQSQALKRGLKILSILGQSPNRYESLATLHEATKLPKSTLVRLLTVLEANQYIKRVNDVPSFRLSYAVLDLADAYYRNSNIRDISLPYLSELTNKLQQTSGLGMLEKGKVALLSSREPDRQLKYSSKIGSSCPSHCTGLGKMLLGGMDDGTAFKTLMTSAPFKKHTRLTMTAPEEIMADVVRSKIRGYSISCEEEAVGVCSISAPIRLDTTDLNWKAAISISGPVGEMMTKQKDIIISELQDTAKAMYFDPDLNAAIKQFY